MYIERHCVSSLYICDRDTMEVDPLFIDKKTRICCVSGCANRKYGSVILHYFPSDHKMKKLWLNKCCIKQFDNYLVICSDHFLPSDYKKERESDLWSFAFPSQNLPRNLMLPAMKTYKQFAKSLMPKNLSMEQSVTTPITVINKIELIENQESPLAHFTGQNACRFCLSEHDPSEMIRIAWDQWEQAPLAKLYTLITKRNLFVAAHCSELCCLACSNLMYQCSDAIELFGVADAFWRSQTQICSVQDPLPADNCNLIIEPVEPFDCVSNKYGRNVDEPKLTERSLDECDTDEFERNDHETILNNSKRSLATLTVCDHCPKVFATRRLMRRHRNSVHASYDYQCMECGKLFKTSKGLRIHSDRHSDAIFECDICQQQFRQKRYIILHMARIHSSVRTHMCSRCGLGFRNYLTWKHHEERQCNVQQRHVPGVYRNVGNFKCYWCPNKYMLLASLRRHYKTKHHRAEYEMVCEQCNTYCETLQQLAEHRAESHSELQCPICKRYFNNAKGMETHITKHKNVLRPFQCEICKAAYDTKAKLNFHHQRAHTFEKPYKCLDCDRRCVEYRDVIKHWKVKHHPFGANLKCSVCEDVLANIFKLYEHVARHTGFKTFQPENS